MKRFLFISVLLLTVCGNMFGQADKMSPCPTLSVTGPAGIPNPGEPILFTVHLSKEAEKYNLEYKWTVHGGEIIEGQGSLSIKVLLKDSGESLTATANVLGLPANCPHTFSESLIYDPAPEAVKIDEFTKSNSLNDKARFDKIIIKIKSDPTAQLYVFLMNFKDTSQETVAQRKQRVLDSLTAAGIEKDRITLVIDFAERESIQFWIVPAGATPPTINQ
jgi:hypothetical protein